MPTPAAAPEVTLWTDDAHVSAVAAVLDLMGSSVEPIGIGGPRGVRLSALGRSIEGGPYDDLRKMLIEKPAAFVLMGTLDDASTEELNTALEQGSTVLTLDPVATDLRDLSALKQTPAGIAGRVVHVPGFLESPGIVQAADPHEVVGEARLIAFTHLGPTTEGSLFSRLFDSWSTVMRFAPLPESVDASLVSPVAPLYEDPRQLTGHFSAHGRLANEGTLTVVTSDRSTRRERALTVIGDDGELSVTDTTYVLTTNDGQEVDRSPSSAESPSYTDLIAQQWRRLLSRMEVPRSDTSYDAEALACTLACLLSARTSEPESPHRVLEMQGTTRR